MPINVDDATIEQANRPAGHFTRTFDLLDAANAPAGQAHFVANEVEADTWAISLTVPRTTVRHRAIVTGTPSQKRNAMQVIMRSFLRPALASANLTIDAIATP